MTTSIAEFIVPARFHTDRRSAVRWLISYAWHYWYLFVLMVFGAFSNAALAAVVPVLMGQAFNAMLEVAAAGRGAATHRPADCDQPGGARHPAVWA